MKGVRKFEGCLFADPESERRFYLYRHIRADSGEIFYVGRGTGNRYQSTYGRNVFWHRVVDRAGGFRAERFLTNLTAEEAIEKEREFVVLYGRRDKKEGTLTNLTDGGEGMLAYTVSVETRARQRKSKLENPSKPPWTGKTRMDFRGVNNPKSKVVVSTCTQERYESAWELCRFLNETGAQVKYQTMLAWLIGQNRKPQWFTFEYEINL